MKGTITKYQRTNGRISWGYYFKMDGRQVLRRGFATKDAAADALALAIDRGLPPLGLCGEGPKTEPRRDGQMVSQYLTYWLEEHAVAPRCSGTTVELYGKLGAYIARHLGKIRLRDLKAAQIQEMVNRLQAHGGVKTEEHPQGRPLSAKRTHAVASLLNTVLSDAVRLEHLETNPMGNRRVRLPKRPKPKPAVLDPSMLAKLFAVANGKRIYPLVVVAAATGARRGELCALCWDDIDFDEGTMVISKSLEQTKKGGLRVKSTKSGESRRLGLDDFALEVLSQHREKQLRDRACFGNDYQDLGLVFCQPNGYYYSPNNVGCGVKELLTKAGLEKFSLHSLRHSHASVLLGNGVPLPVVSERLGHADQTITLQVYSHALPADMRGASKAWRNALAEAISEQRKQQFPKTLSKSTESLSDAVLKVCK
jgi:integrase